MNKEIKVSFEQIKRKCKTIKDLRDLYSNIEKMRQVKGGLENGLRTRNKRTTRRT